MERTEADLFVLTLAELIYCLHLALYGPEETPITPYVAHICPVAPSREHIGYMA